ncbi:MAG: ComEC/Rec2 family competence protein [Solirubrobacterales bacterium]
MRGAGLGPRLVVLGGIVAGLGLAPFVPGPPPGIALILVLAPAACLWGVARTAARVAALTIVAAAGGLWLGCARVAAIDAGALAVPDGSQMMVRGIVEAVPRRDDGVVRVRVDSEDGRLMVEAHEPVGGLPVGHEVEATGTIRPPVDWEGGYFERLGIARVLAADRIEVTGARRGGLPYLTDRLRERAEAALGRGTPEAQAALLRGFVLGQDDRIDPATVEDYQRSGLAHLLAVSGQNVILLALLAAPLLALFGLALRARLAGILVLIALYVPMAGAGASIQRAGVMGAAGVVATLASRPASRWYALLLAAAVTLGLNPRASGDVGWQLSFAAVIGIALWAAPLRRGLGGGRGLRGALVEGAAVTIAATLATAPLMAHHFERLSVAALAANLLALPAIAPVMWLGMLAAAAGQLPWMPVEPITALAGLFAAYISQVAAWMAAPGWAQTEISAPGVHELAGVYAALAVAGWALARRGGRLRALRLRLPVRPRALAAALILLALAGAVRLAQAGDPAREPGLVVRFLDVGQGDAILLAPRGAEPILVDAGPPGRLAADRLVELGVERLAAVVVTHPDADHAGGLGPVLDVADAEAVVTGMPDPATAALVRAGDARVVRTEQGGAIASGPLRLQVLWPPSGLTDPAPGAETNSLSVVVLARWRDLAVLLTGDAEAEAISLDPGPVDVLKLAHHGSEDAGLGSLLTRAGPRLAVASVGAGNPFGHPAPGTLGALREHDVPVLRTDTSGEIVIESTGGGWRVHSGE